MKDTTIFLHGFFIYNEPMRTRHQMQIYGWDVKEAVAPWQYLVIYKHYLSWFASTLKDKFLAIRNPTSVSESRFDPCKSIWYDPGPNKIVINKSCPTTDVRCIDQCFSSARAERKSRVQFEQRGEFMGLIAKVGVMHCGLVSRLVSLPRWGHALRVGFWASLMGQVGGFQKGLSWIPGCCRMQHVPRAGRVRFYRLEGAIYGSYC